MKEKTTHVNGMFKNLLTENSQLSTKSFTLLLSSIVGACIGACLCFCLIYDVLANGYVKTDLADAGVFLLCTGGYMAGAGVTKAMVDMKRVTRINPQVNIDDEDIETNEENG